MNSTKIIFMLSLFLATPAFADWTRVSYNDDSSIYIDKSLTKRSGEQVSVWQLFNFPMGASSPDKKLNYKSSKTLESIDCKANRSKTVEFSWYSEGMAQGRRVYFDTGHDYPWVAIESGSLQSAVKKLVCQNPS